MTSLTKTQQALLQQAKARNGFYSVECGSGRGNKGGRVSFGARNRAALFGLVDAGIVRIVDRQNDIESNHGYAIHTTSFCFQVIT